MPQGVSPLRVTTITTIAGTPGLVLVGLPGVLRLDWGAVSANAWLAVAYASVLSLVVAYLLWNRSVKAIGGTRTAIYMCLTPIVAVLGAWLLLGERPHPLQGDRRGLHHYGGAVDQDGGTDGSGEAGTRGRRVGDTSTAALRSSALSAFYSTISL